MLKADEFRNTLHKRYGPAKGEHVYLRMVAEASGPFAVGGTLHREHVDWAEQTGVPPFTRNRSLSRSHKPMVGRTKRVSADAAKEDSP